MSKFCYGEEQLKIPWSRNSQFKLPGLKQVRTMIRLDPTSLQNE